jgi:hypothetical protein
MFGYSLLDNPYGDNSSGVSLNISVIPVCTALWLFVSGLIGITGIARRK